MVIVACVVQSFASTTCATTVPAAPPVNESEVGVIVTDAPALLLIMLRT